MIEWVTLTFQEHMAFYARYAQMQWSHMTPMRYGVILVSIGVFGWLLMKSSVKKC